MKDFVFHAGKAIGVIALSSILVLAGLLLVARSKAGATTPSPIQLGTAGNYSVFGGAGVTNTGTTTLNADLGANIPITTSEFASPSVIGGQTHAGDAQAAQAESDLVAAYNSAAALTYTATFAGDQAGKTFLPGVYFAGAAIANSATMTLNGQGDPNAVFVFQINAALNPAASSAIDLINGAQASNVFWEVGGAVTIGATASFSGNIMANGAITVGAGSSINGRALAIGIGAVTLANDVITTPDIVSFTSPPTPTSALTSTTTDSVFATGTPGDAGAISYASNTGSVCTVDSTNGALSYLTVGTCTIEATQAADPADSYTSTTANASFPVTAPPAYAVTFNGNGFTSGATAQETDNVPTPLTPNGFVRTGYVFSGWNTLAGGTGTAYADGATYPFGAATTLYAEWTASPAYAVTFNGNGFTSGATAQETDNVPTPLTPNGFVRTGYVFSGWNTLAGGTGTAYADGATYPFGAATTLYAEWTASPAYAVTFNGNGFTSGATAQETDNVPTPLTPNGFVRTGYVFSGWNTLAGGTGTAYADGATYPFGAATTLYAEWTASPAYAVTFNGNGFTSGATAQETDNVPTPLTPNGFVRTGYVFSGWNTLAVGTGTAYADGATYPFGAATTLYAEWTASPAYAVTFNGNGFTSGATAQETDNVPTPLTPNGFVRTGYVFSGWNTLAGGTGTAYADGATYPFGAATTLYAEWTASPAYAVTFNGNGFTSGATAQETDNVPTPLTPNGFVRTGYVFSGWNTLAVGTGTAYADGATYPFGAATTLYAEWTASPPSGGSTTFPPTISSISPALGSVSGGTSVVITGTIFSETSVVAFGAALAVDVIVVNSTTITARSPASTAGSINVTVTTPGGTSSPVPADSFTYTNPAPVVLLTGSPSSATVPDGGGYSGQRAVTNGSGTVSYSETISADSDDVVVSSTGEIFAATSLSPGTYSVSGNDRDSSGDTGNWAFVLTVTGTTPAATTGDYDLVGADGGVFVFGQSGSGYYGSLPGIGVHVNDIVGMAITGDKQGYYLVGRDGGVFAFGDARFDGSLPGIGIHVDDIVGITPATNGGGYFLVAKDGGIFTFGNATFEGSLPGMGIHVTNIVSFATNATGQGYWVVASSGHVYAFGTAPSLGSDSGAVTSIAATPSGEGYWLTGPDGGVFAFGDAPFEGSLPGVEVKCTNIISMVPTSDGNGYLLVGSDGGIFAFGNARFEGSLPGIGVHVTTIAGAVSTTTGLSQ